MEFLEIGKIVKSHGLKGCVKVISYLDTGEVLQSLDEVFLGQGRQNAEQFKLRNIKIGRDCFLLDLEGVDNIDAAQPLVGSKVMVPADKMKGLSEGEYYWRDIIGLEVVTEDGHCLGKIEGIFPTGSNDVYVCAGRGREILLPAIYDVIREIDTEKGLMVVRLLKGL
ncbi:MAG: ribosome maturation factor RimM [Syntrophales bacterium]|nr:ribosome maturation factor RimM [Syntrophales bacterium]